MEINDTKDAAKLSKDRRRTSSRRGVEEAEENGPLHNGPDEPDISTGPFTRPFAHSLAPLTRSLAPHYCAHSHARSLTSLTPSLVGQ